MTLTPTEFDVSLRHDFMTFFELSFCLLVPTNFEHNWHLEKICEVLEDCRLGHIRRLIITVPPRSAKSLCASVSWPAWLLGHNPGAQIICASYSQDLAEKHARDCRKVMTSLNYRHRFPTRLSGEKMAASEFVTTGNGFRLATSVGGQLTGRGADFIILDDCLKPDEAMSDTQRTAVNDWFDSSVMSRLNNKKKGCVVIIQQRLHEDDIVGHVREKDDWTELRLPAIAEEDEVHTIRKPFDLGVWTVERKKGEALHPEREPVEVLEQSRRSLGEFHFAAQYQQSPTPFGGGIVKVENFKSYAESELPSDFDFTLQSWDTANKAAELTDFSVCTTWGVKEKKLYLLNVLRKRLNFPELKREVAEQASLFKPKFLLVEDRASGTQLIQELRHEGLFSVTPYQPKLEKIMRMESANTLIESGFVYLPAQAAWLPEFIAEVRVFPKGKYDDQVDSLSQALDFIKDKQYSVPAIVAFWRMQAEEDAKAGINMREIRYRTWE